MTTEIKRSSGTVHVRNCFMFSEAERRMRLGNNLIVRGAWNPNDRLSLFAGQPVVLETLNGRFRPLTDKDTNAYDWFDPGE